MPTWLKLVLGLAALLLLISRGGMQLLGPLLKLMLPAVAGYIVYKNAKAYLLRDQRPQAPMPDEDGQQEDPIRICPHCGRDIRICGNCGKTSGKP